MMCPSETGEGVTCTFIGIGSNLGDRLGNCLKAVDLLSEITGCRVRGLSGWYLTSPIGMEEQNWFINGVVSLQVEMTARELLGRLMSIEKAMGRVRAERWGPRVIDLDILLFGEDIIDEENLKVPHPRMHLRRFVLVPLAELAPDLVHPVLGVPISQLLEGLPGNGQEVVRIHHRKKGQESDG